MKFLEAYQCMLKGYKVKRPQMEGWFFIDHKTGGIGIHLANGSEIYEGDIQTTIANVLAEDWMILY